MTYPCHDTHCAVLRKSDCLNAAQCRRPVQEFPRRMGTCHVCGEAGRELRRGHYVFGNSMPMWYCAECANHPNIARPAPAKAAGWFWPLVEWVVTRLCLPWYLIGRSRGWYAQQNRKEEAR